VGYVGVDEEKNVPAYERVWKSQNAVGYHSDFYVGEDARRFVRSLWPDFNTSHVGLALHERRIAPSAIAGTSAGAINAVLLATGEAERLAAEAPAPGHGGAAKPAKAATRAGTRT